MNHLEKSAIDGLNELIDSFGNDKEQLHWFADEILLKFLKDSGHEELVKTYQNLRNEIGFWYA